MTVAYLDPGSGSLIASVAVGGLAAAGVAAKQARAKLSGLGRRRKRQDSELTADAAEGGAPADATAPTDATAPVPSD